MARKVKLIFSGVFILLFFLILINLELVVYGVVQGYGQLEIILKAKPVSELYDDPMYPDSLKNKLKYVDSVRRYAVTNLGLKETENYRSVYDQRGKPSMFVVTACDPYKFTPYKWYFPIVGEVPYKGYFQKNLAIREKNKLEERGLDTGIRTAGAWSTLGWFKDPILSNMLNRSKGNLANLIIHELVHSTIFLKGQVALNENLATFVGDLGSRKFLSETYGSDSRVFTSYVNREKDTKIFVEHILRGYKKLDSLYRNLDGRIDKELKYEMKTSLIKKVVTQIDTLELSDKKYFKELFSDDIPNNTYFMSFKRYESNQDSLLNVLNEKYKGNIKLFIEYLKAIN